MRKEWLSLLALGPVVAIQAYADVYMSDEEAVRVIFPGEKFERVEIRLTDDQAKKLKQLSGDKVRNIHLKAFKSRHKDMVFVDQVLGKHELITYAVGIDRDGKVKGIEVLEYRETYGGQVKESYWKKQFYGKSKAEPLRLDEDIKNISGATLSCAHVTGGVRRLLHTYEEIKSQI